MRTLTGDVLYVVGRGVSMQVHLHRRTSDRVRCSQVSMVIAGYPFLRGFNLHEALFGLWPFGFPWSDQPYVDERWESSSDGGDEDGPSRPVGMRNAATWAWETVSKMRDMRMARAAGDMATYDQLL